MSFDLLLALAVFAFVASITPGPNNLMMLASGVNFGFRRTIPHALGITLGFLVLLLAVGFGLGAVLKAFPQMHMALKIAGGAYLLYLAWKIASARSLSDGKDAGGTPMTLLQAAAFQWINPKAWVMAVTGMAVYTDPAQPYMSVIFVTVAFALINLPCVSSWALFGMAMHRFVMAHFTWAIQGNRRCVCGPGWPARGGP
jgi:threonine/homoserine/homoserine lactone efflux protein